MALYKIRCKLSYHQITVTLLQLFITGVRNGIYNNAATFPAPTDSAATFDAAAADFNTKYDLYKKRLGSKGDFVSAKTAMMNILDRQADYVNTVANNNPDTILLAGYEPTKGVTNNVPAPLQAQNVVITRGTPGTLITDCDPVEYADSYGVILVVDHELPETVIMNGAGQLEYMDDGLPGSAAGPEPTPGMPVVRVIMDLNKSRKKTFINLQIGTTYYVYYWSMNANGVSQLSEVVSKKVLEA